MCLEGELLSACRVEEESTLQEAHTLILVGVAQDICSVKPFLLEVGAVV